VDPGGYDRRIGRPPVPALIEAQGARYQDRGGLAAVLAAVADDAALDGTPVPRAPAARGAG
jgi:hypothetical protein